MSGVSYVKFCRNVPIRRCCSINNAEKKPNVRWKEPTGFKTGVKVYSSLLKDKTELITRRKNVISWYSCGPTVYDSPHLGHACCYLHFDIIRRILEKFHQIDVIQVMNVTDIDDKIIRRSNELGVNYRAIALKYEEEFFEQLSRLGIRRPSVVARVSEHMPDIIQFLEKIAGRGFAYRMSDGTMNFLTEKYSDYGKLHQAQEDYKNEADKLSNKDFALWKAAKEGEPYWDSPWGPGRPGWHIECSAIASKYFGAPVDVHSGGIDLLFPHHENEEAQSCVYHETGQWVNYWLHTGHLHLQEQKMSKSLKNVVSLSDFLKDYTADHLRMLCLLIPYRNRIDYSSKVMTNAVAVLDKFNNFFSDAEVYIGDSSHTARIDENILLEELASTKNRVLQALHDDFDTSSAISHLLKLVQVTNSMLRDKSTSSHHEHRHASTTVLFVSSYVKSCLEKLGCFNTTEVKSDLDMRTENLLRIAIDFRSQVRDLALKISKTDSKELQLKKAIILDLCDSLRSNLNTVGVEIKDQGRRTSWSFKR